jgi:hypothetical protein
MKVAGMMGRKLEEDDWTQIYCEAKGIPAQGWSNLRMDVMHAGVGVEHKMLCIRAEGDIRAVCGTSRMHPAATRSIRIDSRQTADAAMQLVFEQYAALLETRLAQVRETSLDGRAAELRSGWMLWRQSLKQFLYFEEAMRAPKVSKHRAEWVASGTGKGARKPSRNLWIYESATGRKRFSVTTDAGAKIQPYFDVPLPGDPNVYVFTVIGEYLDTGQVRIWLTEQTAEALRQQVGGLDALRVSGWLMDAAKHLRDQGADPVHYLPEVIPVLVEKAAYDLASAQVRALNDDHLIRSLLSVQAY